MALTLTIRQLTKSYGRQTILQDCSFSFDRKGIYVLRGANGCGKSTLMRICALLENADGGEVGFFEGGRKLALNLATRRQITLVLPKVGVFNRSVWANVAWPLKIRGLDRTRRQDLAAEALEMVHLTHKGRQPALTLSSGETQRLGIARALAFQPQILMLDEPTASIDDDNTAIIEALLLRLKQTQQTTVIMSTHDGEQARRLADHVLWLRNGRLEPLLKK